MQQREIKVQGEYVLRLVRGEDVLPSIIDFCKQQGIKSGSFRAIGAVEQSKIGYYDLSKKEYGSKEYPDAMEVASMSGNIAQVEGMPFVHAHAVLSGIVAGSENQCVGGHVFEARVAVTLEVHLVAFAEGITRELDPEIGLKLLNL
jgi:predicted DNA-binding protein with PD1-like motif